MTLFRDHHRTTTCSPPLKQPPRSLLQTLVLPLLSPPLFLIYYHTPLCTFLNPKETSPWPRLGAPRAVAVFVVGPRSPREWRRGTSLVMCTPVETPMDPEHHSWLARPNQSWYPQHFSFSLICFHRVRQTETEPNRSEERRVGKECRL